MARGIAMITDIWPQPGDGAVFRDSAVDTAMRVSARRRSDGKPQDLPERQEHERLKDSVGPGRRFPFGLSRTDNANYVWIQLFHSALNEKGRAGFVMANSATNPSTFS
jgi:N-6 DNA Methylase